MRIGKLIKLLEQIRSEKGNNIEVFVLDDYQNPVDIGGPEVYVADRDEYPKEWKIPRQHVIIE